MRIRCCAFRGFILGSRIVCVILTGIVLSNCGGGKSPTAPSAPSPPTVVNIPAVPPPPRTGLEALLTVPLTETYSRDNVRIELRDNHENVSYQFTAEERGVLKSMLNAVPVEHLANIDRIGTIPSFGSSDAAALASWNDHYIVFFFAPGGQLVSRMGGLGTFAQTVGHEIGHIVSRLGLAPEEWADLELMFRSSTDNSDFTPTLNSRNTPYGSASVDEDAADAYGWFARSYHVALLSALEQSRQTGRSILLRKYLHALALFTDVSTRRVRFNVCTPSCFSIPTGYVRTASELSFRVDCSGRPEGCLPMEVRLTLNAANEIARIEYTDPRPSIALRYIFDTNPPIPLPRAALNRIR